MDPKADLDLLRNRGDDALDPIVNALADAGAAVPRKLGLLFRSATIPDDPFFGALLGAVPPVPMRDPSLVREGQEVFALYGPEILLVLGCYALPASYAAAKGVQVIHRARRLKDDAKRRLCETAQMVIDVMHPGALSAGGIGARAAIKVRLMHALVRHHVRAPSVHEPWPEELGVPINQEDLAGTLLTFSFLVLDGLRRIGVEFEANEERGYMEAWRHVGLLLGIDPAALTADVDEARALAEQIGRRQLGPTPEGAALARDLVGAIDALFPIPGYGGSLMHFFLADSAFGVDVASLLRLPPPNWTRILVGARAAQKRFELRWLNRVPGARARRRWVARHAAQRLILLQRPDKETPFEVPPGLLERWRLRTGHRD